jgi:hypothetical protein
MISKYDAVLALVGLEKNFGVTANGVLEWYESSNEGKPTEAEIQAKIAELTAAEPLRLLRIERDRLLQQTDWEIQRNTERNIDSTELITYRNALRDLPQEIESGNISAPTLDDQGNLIFDNWPERNLVNGEPS